MNITGISWQQLNGPPCLPWLRVNPTNSSRGKLIVIHEHHHKHHHRNHSKQCPCPYSHTHTHHHRHTHFQAFSNSFICDPKQARSLQMDMIAPIDPKNPMKPPTLLQRQSSHPDRKDQSQKSPPIARYKTPPPDLGTPRRHASPNTENNYHAGPRACGPVSKNRGRGNRPFPLVTARHVDVRLVGSLVLRNEVLLQVGLLAHPVGQLDDLLAEVADRLLVHVGLSDELREGDWSWVVSDFVCSWRGRRGEKSAYPTGGRGAQRRRSGWRSCQPCLQWGLPRAGSSRRTGHARICIKLEKQTRSE